MSLRTMPGRPPRKLALNLLIAGSVSLVSLVVGELVLRATLPESKGYYVVPPGMRAVFSPSPSFMPGVRGEADYVVNADGIRGRGFGADEAEYRILALGGSTTQCAYLDEPETWTYLVEHELSTTSDSRSVWVGNVGRAGTTSRDHAVQAKYLLAQYPRIDAVMVLVGVNDLSAMLIQGEDYAPRSSITDPAAERERIHRAFALAPGPFHQPRTLFLLSRDAPWYKATAIWQLLKRAKLALLSRTARAYRQQRDGRNYADWRAHRQNAAVVIDETPDLNPALAEYRENLSAIVEAAAGCSTRVIFMTQPVLWHEGMTPDEERLLWLGGVGEFQSGKATAYYSVVALRKMMDRFNWTLMETCDVDGVECLDLASLIPSEPALFYDDAHLTEEGARRVASEIVRYLRGRPPFEVPR
jgi:lysophospholipase L1-like esterase